MINTLLAAIIGTRNDREVKRLQPFINKINALEPSIQKLSDQDLGNKTNEFRERLNQGATLDQLLPEAFAVVREAARRILGQRHYDVQLMGGIILHQGKIAEMKTGEGKTLTATLPLYLNALTGKPAFLVTVNDYLARRDAEWMRPVFELLQMNIGVIQHSLSDQERKDAYNCDIIYGTNNELGFDYLRDNMKFRFSDYVQRDLHYAIVDEVDSILIDEARTPLIISGPTSDNSGVYERANNAVKNLVAKEDYEIDEKHRNVQFTENGVDKVESYFKIDNLYALENLSLLHHVNQALRAHTLFTKDVEYVVHDNKIMIVDEFTGRILAGRRYSDGLHQAIEAKEGVKIEKESQTLASITLQNFFRLFSKLAGMTGTAMTEAEEFHNIYKLEVVSVPTNRPLARQDNPDIIFLTEQAKFKAIVQDIKERYQKGQPVLIGTIAVETSERLSNILRAEGIPHEVLNAKQHEREADIVAKAGEPGHITIATNMAGRGTDIKLTPTSLEAGGLYILGTERHESRRIDNQLRGRSGRQGDKGESRFYISLEDSLIRRFSGDTFQLRDRMKTWGGMTENESIESKFVSKTIESSQEKVEKQHFDSRKTLLEYDDVMNQHRKVIYAWRLAVLKGDNEIIELIRDMITASTQAAFAQFAPERSITTEQKEELFSFLSHLIGLDREFFNRSEFDAPLTETLQENVINFILEQYMLSRKDKNIQMIAQAEKWMMLETIDKAWKQHMFNLDNLQEGINLRSWGQKSPIIEYKREAFTMFESMMHAICHEVVHHIFHINVDHFDSHDLEERREKELENIQTLASDEDSFDEPIRNEEPKIGRNEPCPCGSGKKAKKCCN